MAWKENHKEKMREYNKKYRQANKEKYKTLMTSWYQANKERVNANRIKRYWSGTKEKENAQSREWLKANPEKANFKHANRRARELAAPGNGINEKQWKEIITSANGICTYCKQPTEKLTLDHVIPLKKGGAHDVSNVVAACRFCNSSKRDKSLADFLNKRRSKI